jgi:hypothetical protein
MQHECVRPVLQPLHKLCTLQVLHLALWSRGRKTECLDRKIKKRFKPAASPYLRRYCPDSWLPQMLSLEDRVHL